MPKHNGQGQSSIWEKEAFKHILNELKWPHRLIIGIAFYSGCRISEARQLQADDITGDAIYFRRETTKGKLRARSVPICSELRALLDEVELPNRGYLFPGRKPGTALTRQSCDQALRNACERLGLAGYSTHSCRRSFATRLDKAGVRWKAIASLTGHKSADSLARYFEVSEEELVAAVEV